MKKTIDKCHICGELANLNEEHIPPRAAFNNIPRKMVNIDLFELYGKSDWTLQDKRYKSFQNGFNLHTLCEKCNSFTGGTYGRIYFKVVKDIGTQILEIPKEERTGGLSIEIEKLNCLAFFKQIISMFCSINSVKWGTKFGDYLLNKENRVFDTELYRVSMYLHHGNIDRITPMCVLWNPQKGTSKECSEISFFPFGFVLYDLKKVTDDTIVGMDITDWAKKEYKEEKVKLELPFLICNTGKILDFE